MCIVGFPDFLSENNVLLVFPYMRNRISSGHAEHNRLSCILCTKLWLCPSSKSTYSPSTLWTISTIIFPIVYKQSPHKKIIKFPWSRIYMYPRLSIENHPKEATNLPRVLVYTCSDDTTYLAPFVTDFFGTAPNEYILGRKRVVLRAVAKYNAFLFTSWHMAWRGTRENVWDYLPKLLPTNHVFYTKSKEISWWQHCTRQINWSGFLDALASLELVMRVTQKGFFMTADYEIFRLWSNYITMRIAFEP